MKPVKPALAAVIAGGFVFMFAAPAQAQSLEQALAAAYANNPTIAAARAGVRAADESVPQALANWRPGIAAGAAKGWQSRRTKTETETGKRQNWDSWSWAVEVTQPIFRGGRTIAQINKAEVAVLAARTRLLNTEQNILLQAATAYLDVVRDQATLALNANNERVLRRQLEATRDRFRVGEITRTDVHQAEARVARSQADRIQAENNLRATRATFHNIVGVVPGKLTQPDLPEGLPLSMDEAAELAVANNPNVVSAEYDVLSAEHSLDLIRGELYPQVNFVASAGRDGESLGEDSWTDSHEAKFTLTVPIYQRGSVYSRLREAKQVSIQERFQADKERRDARERAVRAWEALETARARMEAYESQIKAAETALEGVEREAAVGSRTVLDVLDAEEEVLQAKVSLVTAERDKIAAIFQLKEAMGNLTAKKMNLKVDLYDPAAHYEKVRGKWFGGGNAGEFSGKGAKRLQN